MTEQSNSNESTPAPVPVSQPQPTTQPPAKPIEVPFIPITRTLTDQADISDLGRKLNG